MIEILIASCVIFGTVWAVIWLRKFARQTVGREGKFARSVAESGQVGCDGRRRRGGGVARRL